MVLQIISSTNQIKFSFIYFVQRNASPCTPGWQGIIQDNYLSKRLREKINLKIISENAVTNKWKFFVRSQQNKKSRFLCFQKMFHLSFVWAFLVVVFVLVHLQDLPTWWSLLRKKSNYGNNDSVNVSKILRGRYSIQVCRWFYNLLGVWFAEKYRDMFSANQ